MSIAAASNIELSTAEEMADAPALKATEDFVNSRALEILREWASDPEIVEILAEAERVKAADAARKSAV